MKIFEITEAKVEMCPEACCGKPVTECKCGPDCEHCDCHAKNKMNEASTLPPMKKELENLIRNVMSPEDGKKAFYAWIGLNRAANSNVIDGSFSRNRKILNALIQKYNSGGKKTGIFKPAPKSVQVPFDRNRKDLGGNAGVSEDEDLGNVIKTGVKGSYAVVAKAIKDYEELIRNNPNHPKVPQVKAELAKLKPMLAKAQAGLDETATVGGTSAGDVSVITSVPGAKRKVGKDKNGLPKAPQATNADGTAKNALDMTANVMGGKAIKR